MSYASQYPNEAPIYVKLVRACDDPELNFAKIRDKELWWKREQRIEAAKLAESKEKSETYRKSQL